MNGVHEKKTAILSGEGTPYLRSKVMRCAIGYAQVNGSTAAFGGVLKRGVSARGMGDGQRKAQTK